MNARLSSPESRSHASSMTMAFGIVRSPWYMRWVARNTTSISTTACTSLRPLSSASSNTVNDASSAGMSPPAKSLPEAPPGHQGPSASPMSMALVSLWACSRRFTCPRSASLPASSQASAMASSMSAASMSSIAPRRRHIRRTTPASIEKALFPVIAVDLRGRRIDHGEGVQARRILAERDERTARAPRRCAGTSARRR